MRLRKSVLVLSGLGIAGVAATALRRAKRGEKSAANSRYPGSTRRGVFRNGMAYATWGRGPKTLLWIQGGPGSDAPSGMLLRVFTGMFEPFVDDGYTVWVPTRKRHMPRGHSVADMADDYAELIRAEFQGKVDVVVGESFGGMIALYLAASHPESFGHVAVVCAAARISEWGPDVDLRWTRAMKEGKRTEAGTVFTEYMLPREDQRWLRRLLGPLMGRLLAGFEYPIEDAEIEAQAEAGYDARPVLSQIAVPVLLISGDQDVFFPRELVEETAGLIRRSTLVWYEGLGHVKVSTSKRIANDVLAFVKSNPAGGTGQASGAAAPAEGGRPAD
jgi:pimeloyl-ACP methyl ester carboxylesterase